MPSVVRDLLLVALGGSLGAVGRYGIDLAARWLWRGEFPLGTVMVSIVGCLLFGLLAVWGEGRFGHEARLLLFMGFLGAFTTYSTFSSDTLDLWRDGLALEAVSNVAIHVLTGPLTTKMMVPKIRPINTDLPISGTLQ